MLFGKFASTADLLKLCAKSLKFRYVDAIPKNYSLRDPEHFLLSLIQVRLHYRYL